LDGSEDYTSYEGSDELSENKCEDDFSGSDDFFWVSVVYMVTKFGI
jgi:hypothetical protein